MLINFASVKSNHKISVTALNVANIPQKAGFRNYLMSTLLQP